MKFSKTILTCSLALSALTAGAQTKEVVVTEDAYKPNWYIQGQFGIQETLGEISFGDLISPNAQIAVGYNFNSVLGLRLAVNAWQSKAGCENVIDAEKLDWKWYYVAPTVDLTVDLTNLIGGYSPTRKWQAGVLAGVGVNVAWNNDEAGNALNHYTNIGIIENNPVCYYWEGTKARFVGKMGAFVDYNITDKWSVGLELQANITTDHYNSKRALNADWYFNALAGVKYTLGSKKTQKSVTKTVPAIVEIDTVYIDRVVEKIIEKKVEVPVKSEVKLRRDVFFTISNTKISKDEMRKVSEIAAFLYAHPETKVHVMGYADKGTGSKAINLRLSKQRAEAVAKALKEIYYIEGSRIIIDQMDEKMEQPYDTPEKNRVSICIAAE